MFSFHTNQTLPARVEQKMLDRVAELTAAVVANKLAGRVDLSFVDEKTIRALNRHHAGNDYATDVLSFNYRETGASTPLDGQLGEIVICAPIAQAQAEQHGVKMQAEVCLLLIHGLLHLAGYDHQNRKQQAGFSQLQNAIMEKLDQTTRQFEWSH